MSISPRTLSNELKKAFRKEFQLSHAENMDRVFDVSEPPRGKKKKNWRMNSIDPKTGDSARRFLLLPRSRGQQKQKVVVAGEFEMELDGLIADHRLGTIGILQFCDATDAITETIDHAIREAVYLRHLLLETASGSRRPFFVELVLVIPTEEQLPHVSDCLRNVMQQTNHLHSIGINVLLGDEAAKLHDKANLRRAFSWLMTATREWFRTQVDPQPRARRIKSLTLDNLRVAGKRTWRLDENQSLHLIHGHNGTGKSSLSEAFELLMTRQVGRMARRPPTDYARVLTNRIVFPRGTRARMDWELDQGEPLTLTVRDEGPTLGDDVDWSYLTETKFFDPGSFRLDQYFADRLVASDGAQRAETFLAAFFPQSKQAIEEGRQARKVLNDAWLRLRDHWPKDSAAADSPAAAHSPARSEQPPDRDALAAELSWMDDREVSIQQVLKYTPVAKLQDHLRNLPRTLTSQLLPLLDASTAVPQSQLPQRLQQMDKEWAELVTKARQADRQMVGIRTQLAELNQWQVGSGEAETVEQLAEVMNQWLQQRTIRDLVRRQLAILRTCEAAPQQAELDPLFEAWNSSSSAASIATGIESLAQAELALQTVEVEFRERAAAIRKAGGDTSGTVEKPDIDDATLRVLDRLFREPDSEPNPQGLGTIIRQALSTVRIKHGVVGPRHTTVEIGRPGGLERLLDFMESDLDAALQAVHKTSELWDSSFAKTHDDLLQLRQAADDEHAAGQAALEEFGHWLRPDGPLAMATNELVALLTPARWGYEDIIPKQGLTEGKPEMGFATADDVEAFLRLNTAELNTLTLSLFLLCAPRIPNPLRTLVLDDPFQNMDEMTITTIARGVCRLLALWNEQEQTAADPTASNGLAAWRIVILLHGEASLERFRRESPCAVYFLPWLTHSQLSGDDALNQLPSILAQESRLDTELQHIQSFITATENGA